MRVLHFCFFSHASEGIRKQLQYEANAVHNLELSSCWDIKTFCCDELGCNKYTGTYKVIRWLLDNYKKYDIIIFRYTPLLIFILPFRAILRRIILIHHAKEKNEIKLFKINGIFKLIRLLIYDIITLTLSRYIMGVAAVTNEILDFQSRRFHLTEGTNFLYPNGVSAGSVKVLEDKREGVPKFVMMATEYYEWHGLDVLLKMFNEFEQEYQLHIIGAIVDDDMLQAVSKSNRVLYYGKRSTEEYVDILASCDVALGSFALDKKGLTEASSIKVSEFLVSGLPVYSGHYDVSLKEGFNFYFTSYKYKLIDIYNMIPELRAVSRLRIHKEAVDIFNKEKFLKDFYSSLERLRFG